MFECCKASQLQREAESRASMRIERGRGGRVKGCLRERMEVGLKVERGSGGSLRGRGLREEVGIGLRVERGSGDRVEGQEREWRQGRGSGQAGMRVERGGGRIKG
eukprot:2763572-Rhodomonas_salina.1